MTAAISVASPTAEAYDALAAGYDVLTREYAYETWFSALERLALEHGLTGRRVLDVACGTGRSFLPLRSRGYHLTGCDISPEMLARARPKAPDVPLHLADMRDLPVLGSFDLVTCIDDSLNCLIYESELTSALAGIARNLAPGGIALWDLNTIAQYRGQFARDHVVADDGVFVGWRSAAANAEVGPGDVVEIDIDVFAVDDGGAWKRSTSSHRQRHWPRETVEALCHTAGLQLLDVRGQRSGALLDLELDELVHVKAVYVAARKEELCVSVGPEPFGPRRAPPV